MATSVAQRYSRKSLLRSGTGGIVAGTGTGALLLHLAGRDPNWLAVVQFLSPAVSIVTSGTVIWLQAGWNEFVQRKLNLGELAVVRGRRASLKKFLENCAHPATRKQAEQLLVKLDQEELRLIARS